MPFGDLTVSAKASWSGGSRRSATRSRRRAGRRDRDRQGGRRDRGAGRRHARPPSTSRSARSCRWAAASAASGSSDCRSQGNDMKILCANWQAADDAELERKHYPGRRVRPRPVDRRRSRPSSTRRSAQVGRCGHQLLADAQRRRAADRLSRKRGSPCAPASASTTSTRPAGAPATSRPATCPTTAPPKSPTMRSR